VRAGADGRRTMAPCGTLWKSVLVYPGNITWNAMSCSHPEGLEVMAARSGALMALKALSSGTRRVVLNRGSRRMSAGVHA